MGFGGPVWHSSVAPKAKNFGRDYLAKIAKRELKGVGDTKHEWKQWTGSAYHFRRRLTAKETAIAGEVLDLRGTPEAIERFNNARPKISQMAIRFGLIEIKGDR